jgi:hypothetical protein
MSLSPSFPQGAPTLAEVLLQRTFAKPPTPFVDGELTRALVTADSPAVPAATDAGATGADDGSSRSSDGDDPGRSVDVRA